MLTTVCYYTGYDQTSCMDRQGMEQVLCGLHMDSEVLTGQYRIRTDFSVQGSQVSFFGLFLECVICDHHKTYTINA